MSARRATALTLALALAPFPLTACGTVDDIRTVDVQTVTERWSPGAVARTPGRPHDHLELVGVGGRQRFERASVMRVGDDLHVVRDGESVLVAPARAIVGIEGTSEDRHTHATQTGEADTLAWGGTVVAVGLSALLLLIVIAAD